MGFSRAVAPVRPPEADTLTEDMAGIGMNLGGCLLYTSDAADE